MAVEPTTGVAAIQGIGPAAEATLQEAGVFAVFDLLRATAPEIHAAVGGQVSLDRLAAWRRMALFLQIAEVTPQWAEALSRGGIETLDELAGRSLESLGALFRQARTDGIIPAEPSTAQIVEMIRDATLVFHTGSLTGTVRGATGAPLPDVSVRLGQRSTRTDARGRFRLIRIPLGRGGRLVLEHPDHAPLAVEAPPVVADSETVAVEGFALAPLVAGASGSPILDEYEGDVLPPMVDYTVRVERRERGELRDGDVFVVHKLYKLTPDAMLVSMLRSYEAGEFIVHSWKIPLAELPGALKAKEHVTYRGGEYRRITISGQRLDLWKAMRRMRRALAPMPGPTTAAEVEAALRVRKEFLRQARVI